MNKKIVEAFSSLGVNLNGGNSGFGEYRGYQINAQFSNFNFQYPIIIHIAFHANEDQAYKAIMGINSLKISMCKAEKDGFGVVLGFNGLTTGTVCSKLKKNIDNIIDKLNEQGIDGSLCPVCGNPLGEDAQIYNVDGLLIKLDADCSDKYNAKIENENKVYENLPNNYLKGFGGALLGGAIGVGIEVILMLLGVISAWTTAIAIIIGCKLYQSFGGKKNKQMVLITTITSFVMVLLALFVLYIVAANGLTEEHNFTSTGFKAFLDMMTVSDFKREFLVNMILSALFALLGAGFVSYYQLRATKRPTGIKK